MINPIKTNIYWKHEGLEIALLDCSKHSFPKHYHDEYIIGVNLIGGESIWIDGKTFYADLNHVTLYNPGEIQSSRPLSDNWKFISIYFDSVFIEKLYGQTKQIIFQESVLNSSLLANSFRHGALQCLNSNLSKQEVHEYILLLCDGLLRKTDSTCLEILSSNDPMVDNIVNQLSDCIDSLPNLSALADTYSVTPVQLVRTFKRSKGLPPFQWIRVQKLLRVKQDLLNGENILNLSYKYGFSDQSHLTRQFKKQFGFTPAAYQNSVK